MNTIASTVAINSFPSNTNIRRYQGIKKKSETDDDLFKNNVEKRNVRYDLQKFLPLALYFVWVWIGIIWYHYYDNWTLATSYYYAVEAGLSIGFCNPSERDDGSRGFTIIYVILGSVTTAGALGSLVSRMLNSKSRIFRKKYVLSVYDPDKKTISARRVISYLWYEFKYNIGWYSNRKRVIVTTLFIIWMGVGTTYGMVVEKWTFITSLYWAITSCSTGGLQSAPCLSPNSYEAYSSGYFHCDMGVLRGALMGSYFVIGVPIYALFAGEYASVIVSIAIAGINQEKLSRPIETDDFLFAANILSEPGSTSLQCGEFILLQLMRLGQTDANQIVQMKQLFHKLDAANEKELNISQLKTTGFVKQSKHPMYEIPIREATHLFSRVLNLSRPPRASSLSVDEDEIEIVRSKSPDRVKSTPKKKSVRKGDEDDIGISSNELESAVTASKQPSEVIIKL